MSIWISILISNAMTHMAIYAAGASHEMSDFIFSEKAHKMSSATVANGILKGNFQGISPSRHTMFKQCRLTLIQRQDVESTFQHCVPAGCLYYSKVIQCSISCFTDVPLYLDYTQCMHFM